MAASERCRPTCRELATTEAVLDHLVGERVRERLAEKRSADRRFEALTLPAWLKADASVRTGILRRLAASPRFARGDRAGTLRAAQRRSGRGFRLDVRQRVVVKAMVSRHAGAPGSALLRHVSYLGRAGAGVDGERPAFFDRERDHVAGSDVARTWSGDRHHFRFIVSPEHGDRIADFEGYIREVMRRVGEDLSEPELTWIATAHFDTDQPHAHVLVRGRRSDGRDLVIPRAYIGYGVRARAQEAAQERLGDLSRHDAERRIWREVQADRFTGFDRRLLESRLADGTVEDGAGRGAWAALLRGRLIHLEQLGLAARDGRRYRLDAELEGRLRRLQLSRDVIRTINQRRLEAGGQVQEFQAGQVRGRVVRSGLHDELGAEVFVIVRASDGVEHYARLRAGSAAPEAGRTVLLTMTDRGVALTSGMSAGRDLGR